MATNRHRIVDESNLHVTSIFKSGDHAVLGRKVDNDEEILVALGYKQEFKRDFSIWSSFSVSFSVLGLLPSIASTLGYNLGYSGPAGSVWGWLVAGLFIQCVALAMAELCSSMPTAGGLYYASAVLAPEGWGPLCAWVSLLEPVEAMHTKYIEITGWSNFLGLATGPCSVNYALAAMILTAAEIANPDYVAQTYQIYLLLLALLIIDGLLTMNSTKLIGRLNLFGAIFNLIVVFIFIIWMPAGSISTPKGNPNSEVWTSEGIINGTEWPTGFAFLMGFLSVIWTIAGYDAPFHLSEECSNSNIASPRAIVMTAQMGLYLGWAIILVIAYTVQNIEEVVAGPYGQPLGSLCLQVLGPKAGLAMFSLNIVAQFFVGQGITVSASRVTFAYSRDGALPFSSWLSVVNKYTETPVNAVWTVLFIDALLGLLMFASPAAISAVFSIGAIGQYIAFIFPIALKLFVAGDKFRPGPWHLGRFSKPIGVAACAFVALMIPVLCFPATNGKDLTAFNMNYSCLIYGGSMFLALLWYAVDARKRFKGPRINVEHLGMASRVLDGQIGGVRESEKDGEEPLEVQIHREALADFPGYVDGILQNALGLFLHLSIYCPRLVPKELGFQDSDSSFPFKYFPIPSTLGRITFTFPLCWVADDIVLTWLLHFCLISFEVFNGQKSSPNYRSLKVAMNLLQFLLFTGWGVNALIATPYPTSTVFSTPTSTLHPRDDTSSPVPTASPAQTDIYFSTTSLIIIPGVTNDHVTIPAKTITLVLPTCSQTITPDANGYVPPGTCGALYSYYPSFVAAVITTILFGCLSVAHIFLAAKWKATYCWPLIVGVLWETLGFTTRSISTKYQQSTGLELTTSLFVLLAPLWINAHAYITLSHLLYTFHPTRSLCGISARTLSTLFVSLDLISFVIQLIGGSWAGPSSPEADIMKGIHIYMGGIGIQQFFIFVFLFLGVKFQREMRAFEQIGKVGSGKEWKKLFSASSSV
ncbi:hypothetical protein G7Y89_g14262 [Cudoniella acicularis]|uniref:Amino acid transporter n=1 Tax=Cudoniella acicularis TaxID=354080 RepID=A0A8H4R4I2_9HELO|nr:hypothetical protein G7Y89_g14262 [Cudoniella acicularis]